MNDSLLIAISKQLHRIETRLDALELTLPSGDEAATRDDSIIHRISEATSDIILEGQLTGRIDFVSQSVQQLGYSVATILHSDGFSFVHPDDLDHLKSVLSRLSESKKDMIEIRVAHADGRYLPFECLLNLIDNSDESGEPRVIMVARDISERLQSVHRLQQSLAEKDVLLKEIHHRVKNNLQIISSMLNIQSHYFGDPKAKGVFKECQHRIKSMALVHETLYQSKNLAEIEFSTYVKNLVNRIVATYREVAVRVEVTILIPELHLHIDTAVACGLIINELVTNALKYAFADGRSGQLWVTLIEHEGKYLLTVRDDGVGFPKGIDPTHSNSMGLQLVMTLADQLDADLDIEKVKGTSITLAFSERHHGVKS